MKIFALLSCCALAVAAVTYDSSNPVVQSPAGSFKGSVLQSRLGNNIYSFRGIRYGEAPTGEKRFRQASPAPPQNDVVDASQDGPSCPQPASNNRVISEDCLRLNVYTNSLPQGSSSQQRDVVVFIHPGAFYSSSASSQDFGPQNLLDRDIVLVTINYRLGSLGFLSIDDARAPGNAGLKDQVLALRWVQQNIQAFGGNPKSVTLLGYGSGANSVSLHIVSPLSSGLFHRAIAMSGAATDQNSLPANQKDLAKKQAEILGCPSDNNDNLLKCLYQKSAEDFANSPPQFAEYHAGPALIWSPVVESSNSGNSNQEAFLSAQPADLIRQKKANFVPLITGVNRDELGSYLIQAEEQAQKGNTTIYDQFNNQWEKIAPLSFAYERNSPRSQSISRELKSYYLQDQPVSAGKYHGLARLYADALTIFQVSRFERLMANNSNQEVYNYHYQYEGCDSQAKWSNGSNFGVAHQDELYQLFKVGQSAAPCQQDIKNIERLTGIIENFAKSGQPIAPNSAANYSNVQWKPSNQNEQQHVDINNEWSLKREPINQDRINEFEKLFPLPPVGSTTYTLGGQ